MRIGIVYHQFRSNAGGLERYLFGLASNLAAEGHRLVLIGHEFDHDFSTISGAKFRPVSCRGTKTARMRQFAEKSGIAASEAKVDCTLGFGRTYAQDIHRAGGGCHRVYSRFLPAHKRIRRKNQWELALEERLYAGGQTRHFVVNSGLVGEQLRNEYNIEADRISTIHTPVDTVRFTPADERSKERVHICEKLGTDPERPALLFVSLSHRRKGLSSLIDVWPEIDADLWIAGTPLRTGYRRAIARRGLNGRIHHLGETKDLVPYYQAADGFLHPTLYDACANTVLQSMACGLPGLISKRDGASEFVHEGENGFLLSDPEEGHEVLAGIRNILGLSSERRQIMGKSARQTVLPLTWQGHLAGWRAVIAREFPKLG